MIKAGRRKGKHLRANTHLAFLWSFFPSVPVAETFPSPRGSIEKYGGAMYGDQFVPCFVRWCFWCVTRDTLWRMPVRYGAVVRDLGVEQLR